MAGPATAEGSHPVIWKQPPRFATWLLKLLGPISQNEFLTGDLVEEFQSRRSVLWYWRQVMVVIFVHAGTQFRSYKRQSCSAILAGLMSLFVCGALVDFLEKMLEALSNGGLFIGGHVASLPYAWGAYYPRSHYDSGHPYPFFFNFCAWLMCYAASGHIVRRLHGAHQASMLVAYLGSLLAWTFFWIYWGPIGSMWNPPSWWGSAALEYPKFVVSVYYPFGLVGFLVLVSAAIGSTLSGGLWSMGSRSTSRPLR